MPSKTSSYEERHAAADKMHTRLTVYQAELANAYDVAKLKCRRRHAYETSAGSCLCTENDYPCACLSAALFDM